MMKVLLALACAGALLLFAPAAAAQVTIDDPALEFRGHVVHATSLRPGAQVLLFGVARDHDGYNAVIRRWSEVLTDSDHDGQVELDLGSNVPFQSIFAVVDLNDGHYTVASPTGFGAIPPKRAKMLRRGPRALVDRMTSPGPMADAVYVQPGAGAWKVQLTDGVDTDRDGAADGATTFAVSDFSPLLPGLAVPQEFQPGGILIVINAYDMDLYAQRLDAAVIGGVQ